MWGIDSKRLAGSVFEFPMLVSPSLEGGVVVRRGVVDVRLIGDCIKGPESVETPVAMGSESLVDAPET